MYTVESYDASDEPDDRRAVSRGQYQRLGDALAAAREIIEANLVLSLTAGLSAGEAYEEWRQFGDVPKIVARNGTAPILFDPFTFAQTRARELERRA
jgi:hypothetical protein